MNWKSLIFAANAMLCLCSCGKTVVYVSPEGDDSGTGNRSHPFRTIMHAIDVAAEAGKPATVFLREGRYELAEGISLDGVHDICIESYRDEDVVISGAREIPLSSCRRIEDESVLCRIKPGVRDNARVIDFKELGLEFNGVTPKGFGRRPAPSWSEVLVDDKPMELARWPKGHDIPMGTVLSSGRTPRKGKVLTEPVKLPVFEYENDELNSFEGTEGLWLWGYFSAGYAEDMVPLAAMDTVRRTITAGLTSVYGFGKCTEGAEHKRWAMRNVLEEMTEPGECVMDPAGERIYFLPPAEDMHRLEVTVLDTTMVTMSGCSGISFKGLTFQGGRGDGIVMEDCHDCVLDHCVIRNIGRLAVHMGAGRDAVRNGLSHCQIYDIGSGGVELFGGDRISLSPGQCFVEYCSIHNVNRMDKSYRPAVKFGECGNRVSHCEIYDAPSMAILFNGNNQLIEYCDIHDVCREISDQAAIYYGRNPTERGLKINYSYLHDIRSGWKKWVFGIYHDDGACGMDVYGCVFKNIESSAANIGGGSDISYRNCIFMESESALSIDDRIAIHGKEGHYGEEYRKKFEKVNFENAPYCNEYPEIKNYFKERPEVPKRIIINTNLYYKVDRFWEAYVLHSRDYLENWERYPIDTDTNPGLIDPSDPMKGLDMKKVHEIVPEFKAIPFDEIGCK